MYKHSDEQLVVSYLKGDEESLAVLIKRYLKPIYNFVYKYAGNAQNAEDITQDVFVKMWRNLKKFKRQKNFKTWIFSIAKNTSIDFLRKKKTIPFSEFDNEEGEDLQELIERRDLVSGLSVAINKLSPKYREVVFLRNNNDFTFQEIAKSLGESLNTIKSRYRRALATLKKTLAESAQ